MANRLSTENLQLSFGRGNRALAGVSLRLTPGVTAVLGPNGSGKSTLLRCLASVLTPTRGEVRWNGGDVWRDIASYRWLLGYLPQSFSGHGQLTVKQFLGYMAALKLLPLQLAPQRVSAMLTMFNLQAYADTRLTQLSGGLLHRVGLAQAILNDPDLLIMDEPTVSLDAEERLALLDLIRQQAQERIVVFSTHMTTDAEAVADRLVILNDGRVLAHLPTSSLIEQCRGLVWELELPDASALPEEAIICRSTTQGKSLQLRVILPERPPLSCTPGCPSLEDAYLAAIHRLLR